MPSTTPVDLLLIAGIPNPQHIRAQDFLKQIAGAHAKVIAVPSGSHDGRLFREGTIDTLLRGTAQFAIRRFKNRSDDQTERPKRIALFYVPADDDRQLLKAFDFFVFPIPLRDLAAFDETGRQKRHQPSACENAIKRAFDVYSRDLVGIVERRIKNRKSSEPLLLPPLNFHLPDQRLQQVFSELTLGTRTWENALPEDVLPTTFDKEGLPNFLHPNERQTIYRDARNVVFPCARPNELHAQLPDIAANANVRVLLDFLRSTYRFGASLPYGFHHDAQLEHGHRFNQMSFQCSRNGEISVSATHANI
jgi:hypothetical protein